MQIVYFGVFTIPATAAVNLLGPAGLPVIQLGTYTLKFTADADVVVGNNASFASGASNNNPYGAAQTPYPVPAGKEFEITFTVDSTNANQNSVLVEAGPTAANVNYILTEA